MGCYAFLASSIVTLIAIPILTQAQQNPSECLSYMPSVSACVNSAMQAISSNSEPTTICPQIQKAAACYPAGCCADSAVKASVDEQMKQLAQMVQLAGATCPVTCGSVTVVVPLHRQQAVT